MSHHKDNEDEEYDNYSKPNNIGMKIEKSKNKGASLLQVTAEQIIRASQAHVADEVQIPFSTFDTPEELEEYKTQRRKKFEIQTQRQRYNIRAWFKYADWEEHIKEISRARNIYERAILTDYRNISLWLRYAEMEIKNKNINHARNIWERAIKLHPRVDQFWFKYTYMEEMLGNYIGARAIFKSWMSWKPSENAWLAYAKFEERMGELENARQVLYKYLEVENKLSNYILVAKFEEKNGNSASTRAIYEAALADLGDRALDENFFINFIKFEIKNKEIERARVLFRFGLDNIPKQLNNESNLKEINDFISNSQSHESVSKLYSFYTKFEKMYGNTEHIDEIVINKRRKIYEGEVKLNSMNYDLWFDYISMEEGCLQKIYTVSTSDEDQINRIRELYERAIVNKPVILEKKYWRRYVYLWINYAIFEESLCDGNFIPISSSRASSVYEKIIDLIPHHIFTFSKIWILYSHYLIRQKDLTKCRQILGKSIGICPDEKIIQSYIEFEMQLGNLDRCRTLFEKSIECFPISSSAWIKYSEFEDGLDEYERATAILEAATSQVLDFPDLVWKAYIALETNKSNFDKVRSLYRRLLEKTDHLKVWMAFAKFEQEAENNYDKISKVFKDAYYHYKNTNNKEDRAAIAEAWLEFEKASSGKVKEVEALQAVKIKKRKIVGEEENDENENWEEYYDYVFNDDKEQPKSIKLLQVALEWKKKQENNN